MLRERHGWLMNRHNFRVRRRLIGLKTLALRWEISERREGIKVIEALTQWRQPTMIVMWKWCLMWKWYLILLPSCSCAFFGCDMYIYIYILYHLKYYLFYLLKWSQHAKLVSFHLLETFEGPVLQFAISRNVQKPMESRCTKCHGNICQNILLFTCQGMFVIETHVRSLVTE